MRNLSFYLSLSTSFFILNLSLRLCELDAKLYYRMLCYGTISTLAAIKTSIVLEYVIHISIYISVKYKLRIKLFNLQLQFNLNSKQIEQYNISINSQSKQNIRYCDVLFEEFLKSHYCEA